MKQREKDGQLSNQANVIVRIAMQTVIEKRINKDNINNLIKYYTNN